jgi:hypothetical protein
MGGSDFESWNRQRGVPIVGSILLHVLLIVLYVLWAQHAGIDLQTPLTAPGASLTTRVLTEKEFQKTVIDPARLAHPLMRQGRTIVESQAAEKPKAPLHKQARFLGERTQRVEEETIASGFGSAFGGSAAPPGPRAPREDRLSKTGTGRVSQAYPHPVPHSKPPTLDALGLSGGLPHPLEGEVQELPDNAPKPVPPSTARKESHPDGPLPPPGDGALAPGRLARGSLEGLPKDVATGVRTLLNTDEFQGASFYNRLRREVAPRWEPIVESVMRQPGRVRPGQYTTIIEFWLNAAGIVTRAEVAEASHERSLDEAARDSILSLPIMHNPPSQLRQSDGTYRLTLGFIVQMERGGVRVDYAPDPRL